VIDYRLKFWYNLVVQVIFLFSLEKKLITIMVAVHLDVHVGFVQETGHFKFSMLLHIFFNAVITLIKFILINLFMKLTLDIRISFSCLWLFLNI